MSDNRIGTFDALPALTVSGKLRTPDCPLTGIGGGYVVARDVFPSADEDAVIAALTASVSDETTD